MTITMMKTIFITLIVLGIIMFLLTQGTVTKKRKLLKITSIAVIIICVAVLGQVNKIHLLGRQHGLYYSNITVDEIKTGIEHTPIEDKFPNDPTNEIIILYRWDCDDCRTAYPTLSKELQNAYWISSRSKKGQELVAQYNIESVPVGLYFHDEKNATKKYLTTENHNVNIDGVNRLLELQEKRNNQKNSK